MEKCVISNHNIMNHKINLSVLLVLLITIVLLGACSPGARVKCGCPPKRSVVG